MTICLQGNYQGSGITSPFYSQQWDGETEMCVGGKGGGERVADILEYSVGHLQYQI